jgi:molybdopterin molybdotransferase
MLTFRQAQQMLTANAKSFGKEVIDLNDADGRVLSEAIEADRDYPPFNRATMDGYAINLDDFNSGIRNFEVVEIIYAGQSNEKVIEARQCYKIMTGSPVPPEANLVIRKEDTTENGNLVNLNIETAKLFQNIARQGEDIKQYDRIIESNIKCTPSVISLLASIGKHKITVEQLPTVSLFTTGDEIVDITNAVTKAQIRNSNRYLLQSLLKRWLIKPVNIEHIKDDESALLNAFEKASTCNIIIVCGGVSAGDADYVPGVLEKLGAEKLFHKLAIKPGKPIWCGKLPNGGIVFALPGNPLSCLVTFKLFINLFLSRSFNLAVPFELSMPLYGTRTKKSSLDEFFPVKITGAPAGLEIIPFNGSGDVTAALGADAIAHHPMECEEISDGRVVTCYPLF